MEFNDRLAKWFKKNGISQKAAAQTMGYLPSYMNHFFRSREPNYELLSKLAQHYPALDMNCLFRDEEIYTSVNFIGEPPIEYTTKNMALIEDIENKLEELKAQMTRK